ncbi:MAG: hypothetical protein HDS88_06720 [Bacteroidales bacterium]|nr:hypothetical protein [Bacteroidales bacterium]
MKKGLLLGMSALAMAATFSARAESVAHGYQMGDEKNQFGFISFKVSEFLTPTMDQRNYGETHVSAGECVNGIYYTFEVYPDVMGGVSAINYRVRDAKTFEVLKHVEFYNNTRRVVDMTYDYTTNTMYALVEDAISTGAITRTSLNVVDLNTGDCIVVGSAGDLIAVDGNGKEAEESLLTLAADAEGNLYAMGEYRQFYKLDKLTGKASQIGFQHSIATMNQFQSMAFDTEGVLYWAQTHPDYGYFLTINPKTGIPSYMVEDPDPGTKWKNEGSLLGDNAEVTGLWFEKDFNGKAPAAPSDLKTAIGEKSPNEVTLTWTVPTKDLAGDNVSVSAINVYRFGQSQAIATLAADATSYIDKEAPNGNVGYMVSAVSGELHGRGAVATVYCGADELMPVSDITIALEGDIVSLSWKAPTSTYNGGYADYDNITYDVWRIKGSDEMVVASGIKETTFSDQLPEAGTYKYSIVPFTCGVEGYAADSEEVTYTTTASIPYLSGFEDEQDGSLWKIFNNHSNSSYGWSVQLGYAYQRYDGKFAQLKSYSASEPCDDYLFSPAIEFTPGTYQLNYMVNGSLSSDTHSWSVYVADGATPEADVVAEIESHDNEQVGGSWVENATSTFTIEKAGVYHLAFHGTTTSSFCTLKIDNVSVTKAPASIPYTCDFEEESDVESWKIDNTNPHVSRGAGWSIAQKADSPAGSSVVKLNIYSVSEGEYNDWLISPAITFPKAGSYVLTFSAQAASYDTHKWGAYLGTDPNDYATFEKAIVEYDKAKFSGWTDYTAEFDVEEPGTYHLGLNGKGCDTVTNLHIDNIRLTSKTSGVDGVAAGDEEAEIIGYYNLQGQQIDKPAKGLVIVRYSNGKTAKVVIK